jgi:hypothetical protein
MDDFSIEIDDKNSFISDTDVYINKDKPITKLEVSPNEKYLVIYNGSIVGWNVTDSDDKKHDTGKVIENLDKMWVSDDKKLAYICKENIISK